MNAIHSIQKHAWVVGAILLLGASPWTAWERKFNFDKDELNIPPKGLVVDTPPRSFPLVIVQNHSEAPSAPSVLTLRGSRFPGANFFNCLLWFSNIKNGDMSLMFRHEEEPETIRTIGLIWRSTDKGRYSFTCDTKKSTCTLAINTGEKPKILERKTVSIPGKIWHLLSAKFKDDQMICELDGKPIFNVSDKTLEDAGQVGFFIQSDTIIYVDNFNVLSRDESAVPKDE